MDRGHTTGSADWPPRPGRQLSTVNTDGPGFPPVRAPRNPTWMLTISVRERRGRRGAPSWFPRWERKLLGPLATERCERPTSCPSSCSQPQGSPDFWGLQAQTWKPTEQRQNVVIGLNYEVPGEKDREGLPRLEAFPVSLQVHLSIHPSIHSPTSPRLSRGGAVDPASRPRRIMMEKSVLPSQSTQLVGETR